MNQSEVPGELLTVRDLEVGFRVHGGHIAAVRGVSFCVRAGSTVALVGESGSGKTVTAHAIMGILPESASITSGSILFDDPLQAGPAIDIAKLKPSSAAMQAIRGGRISIIFQEPMVSLSPLHTVGDQVSEALFLHRDVGTKEGMELTESMLAMAGFPDPRRAIRTYPFELSGGLRQRAMVAMALICRPALLIADEPTTALDVTIQAQILKLIKDLQSQLDMAVLIITHDLGVVANVAEEVVVMYHGEIMESGTIADVFEKAAHPYLQALLRAVPKFDMRGDDRLIPVREIEHEIGPLIKHAEVWSEQARNAGPHLSLTNLSKTFQIRKSGVFGGPEETQIKAVDNVSLDIACGESFGLVGESGCGKTTLSKIIMGALRPDTGEVRYNDRGTIVDTLSLDQEGLKRYRHKVQFIFQDPFSALNPRMTVFDIIREPLIIHQIGDDAHHRELVQELMRLVGLNPRFLNRYPHSFSGGQRQRLGIARALALQPDLLICDEPVSALDVSIQAQVLNLLKDLREELGLTYLFISHNLAVVDYIAERIAVMCGGQIVEVAPREILFRAPVHPYTKTLLVAVPYPDLNRPLDFAALMKDRLSDPKGWPEPFCEDLEVNSSLVEIDTNHFVRMTGNAVPENVA
ncbi:MAG: ABC transporter ATP-binding protein [Gammaproteobacteria bacterium]|nr:ABC transporter ATP-binding protein [Gammaproteobacteria bacterium]